MEINDAALKWIKTTTIAALGGGVAACFTAAMDPAKYRFPQDFGTGKLWPYFFQGAGLIFVGLLIKSPLGQKTLQAYKDSQAQAAADRETIDQLKAQIKPGTPGTAAPPPGTTKK